MHGASLTVEPGETSATVLVSNSWLLLLLLLLPPSSSMVVLVLDAFLLVSGMVLRLDQI